MHFDGSKVERIMAVLFSEVCWAASLSELSISCHDNTIDQRNGTCEGSRISSSLESHTDRNLTFSAGRIQGHEFHPGES